MLHETYASFLDQMQTCHNALGNRGQIEDYQKEVDFMRGMAERAAKLVEYGEKMLSVTQINQEMTAILKETGIETPSPVAKTQQPAEHQQVQTGSRAVGQKAGNPGRRKNASAKGKPSPRAYTPDELETMKQKPDTWSETKILTSLAHPEIHPDSLNASHTGIMKGSWTWDDMNLLTGLLKKRPYLTADMIQSQFPSRSPKALQEKIYDLTETLHLTISAELLPTYTDEELSTMESKPDEWSEAKRRVVLRHPEVHPDSIRNGKSASFTSSAWMWDDIRQLCHAAKTMSISQLMALFPNRTEAAVCRKRAALGIMPADDIAEKDKQKKTYTSIEECLPRNIRKPSIPERLRIFRLQSGIGVTSITAHTGISRTDLYAMEAGDLSPTAEQISALATEYHITPVTLMESPISESLPLAPNMTREERLRRVRIRAGLSYESFAKRIYESVSTVVRYEAKAPDNNTIEVIAQMLHVPSSVILYGLPPADPVSLDNMSMSTGELVRHARASRNMSITDLANAAKCSISHVQGIENQRSLPSKDMLARLAKALSVPTSSLEGLDIRQPRAVTMSRAPAYT